jgi:peptide/nickel transport system substrate-binding protein
MVILTGLLAAGCGHNGDNTGDTTDTQGTGEQVLTVEEMWNIDGIDPANDGTLMKEKALVVETLVECKPNFELEPGLATSWENINPTTWKFALREGVTFHDGTPMNAENVKWSLERALNLNPRTQSFTKIESITAQDTHTLLITTTEPNADLPAALHYSNTSVIGPNSIDEDGNLTRPIGTGAFKFESWDKGTGELIVTKNETYWKESPIIDMVVFRPLPDPNTRALSLEKGEIDFTCDPPYNELNRLSEMDAIKIDLHETARNYVIQMNLKEEPFSSLKVRQAVSHAIDREAIVEHILFGCGAPAKGPFMPGMAWTNEELQGYSYDPERAMNLLSEAGWEDSDGDGIIDKDGTPFRVTLMTYPQRPGLPPMAQAIQSQLQEVGIDMEVQVMDYSAITAKTETGQWDMKLSAMATAMIPTPSYYLQTTYHSGNNQETGYHNETVDRLIAECMATFDQQEKYDISRQIQKIISDEAPVITVAHYGVAVAMKEYIKGFEFNPTAHDYMLTPDMYIEE